MEVTKTFTITYEPNWTKMRKGFSTTINAVDKEAARAMFAQYYPMGKIKTIK